jgi:hypothetical protein
MSMSCDSEYGRSVSSPVLKSNVQMCQLRAQTGRLARSATTLSTFALSRSPTFKLSTTGPRPFVLLHRTSLRPLTPADELCDLTGQMIG